MRRRWIVGRRASSTSVDEMRDRPAPERIAGADVDDDQRDRRRSRRRAPGDRRQPRPLPRRRPSPIGNADGSGGAMPSGASRSHWFSTEWRGRSSRGRATRTRIHPAAAGDLVADAHRRAAQPGQQRGARPAVEIDRQIVAPRRAAAAPSAQIVAQRRASRARAARRSPRSDADCRSRPARPRARRGR